MAGTREHVMRLLRGATAASVVRMTRRAVKLLAEATPVDTGHARSNWIASIGSPFRGVVGSKEEVNDAAQAASLAALSGYRLDDGQVFVTNNVEYVGRLNAGSSSQAPANFIESAIESAVSTERVVLDLEKAR